MTMPVPITIPPRAELWRRVRLAEAILSHRTLAPRTTVDLLLSVLRGEDIPVSEHEGASASER